MKENKQDQYSIAYYVWKAALYLAYTVVAAGGIALKAVLAFVLSDVLGYRKKVILANLELAGFGNEKKEIAKANYKILATYLTEIVYGMFASYESLAEKLKYQGLGEIQKAIDNGKHVILLGSHFGNWEWASILLARRLDCRVTAVYKPLSNKALDRLMYERRNRFGIDLASMAEIVRHIRESKSPGVYMLVSDQSPAIIEGSIAADLFGVKTYFFAGPEKISQKYGMAVMYQQIVPQEKGGYKVNFIPMEGDNITEKYATMLEKDILQWPEYWLWSHKRWKLNKA